jgi:hypothetical protein
MKMKHNQNMGHNESNPERKTHSSKCLKNKTKQLKRAYTSSLTVCLKALEQKEANSPKRSRLQEIIKPRAEINQIKTKRTIQRINKIRNWFFDKLNKIDKLLARLTRGHRDSIKINKNQK